MRKGLEVAPPLISASPPAGGQATKRGIYLGWGGGGRTAKAKGEKEKKTNLASLLSGFSLLTFEDFCLWGKYEYVS